MRQFLLGCVLVCCGFFSASAQQTVIDSLQSKLDQTADIYERSLILQQMGKAYLVTDISKSIESYRQLEANAVQLENDELNFRAQIGLGTAYTDDAKYDSAQVYLDLAQKFITKEEDYERRSTYLINQGNLYFHIASYEQGIETLTEALVLAKQQNKVADLSRIYNNIALCHNYLGQYEESLKMHIASAKIADSLNDPIDLAKSYNNIGLVYHDLEQYEKSEEYYLKAIDIKKEMGNTVGVVSSYHNLGSALRRLGIKKLDMSILDRGKEYYEQALALSEETNYGLGITISYINLALMATTVEDFDKGIEYGKIAIERSIASGDLHSEMTSRINIGDTYQFKGDYEAAERELKKGLELAKQIKDAGVRQRVYYLLSRLYRKKNDTEQAFAYYRGFVRLKDSISSTEVKNKVNELEARYESEKSKRDLAETRANLAEKELEVKRKNTLIIGGFGLALVLALLGYLVYNQQKLKNRQLKKEGELKAALARIETQNKLQEQRLRISRDLHDNIGSQLTFVASSVDNLKFGLKGEHEAITDKLSGISEFTTQTIYELRDTIWAMNKNAITTEDLQSRIANFIEKAGRAHEKTEFRFEVSDGISKETSFTSVQGMNMYRIIQEAVNNALKYANASVIEVGLAQQDGKYLIQIDDNGSGFDPNQVESGNGLSNMKKRASDLGGAVSIESQPGQGTHVKVEF